MYIFFIKIKNLVYYTTQKYFEKYMFSIIKGINDVLNVSRIIFIQIYFNLTELQYFYRWYNFLFFILVKF
jgi:hypothetical protein